MKVIVGDGGWWQLVVAAQLSEFAVLPTRMRACDDGVVPKF